jgi:hypothetical protein
MRPTIILLVLCACDAADVSGTLHDAQVIPEPDALACEGACKTTALTATFMATRTLDVAYYGTNTDLTLHLEAYAGAAAGCPTMNSPTPDYTLILGRINMEHTSPASFIDFKGDMLPSVQPISATAVTLTPVTFDATFVAYDVMLTFDAGTISGHLYATHCDSLDE